MTKGYIIELVGKEAPYFCEGYMNSSSIVNDKLVYTSSIHEALIVNDKDTMNKALGIITKNNADPRYMNVMPWITQIGDKKRIFPDEIVWEE